MLEKAQCSRPGFIIFRPSAPKEQFLVPRHSFAENQHHALPPRPRLFSQLLLFRCNAPDGFPDPVFQVTSLLQKLFSIGISELPAQVFNHIFPNLISPHIVKSLGNKKTYIAPWLHLPWFYSLEYKGAVGYIDGSGFAVCQNGKSVLHH